MPSRIRAHLQKHVCSCHWYWKAAKKFHRMKNNFQVSDYSAPLDPLKIIQVNPDKINQESRRSLPYDRPLGAVKSGDWDQPKPVQSVIPDSSNGWYVENRKWYKNLMHSKYFENSTFYKSHYLHFVENVDWVKTPYVQNLIEGLKNGYIYKNCTTPEELLSRCEKIDQLYYNIKDRGYRTQYHLGEYCRVDKCLRNEIMVDIGRDGTLLLLTGRHRLTISKILDLSTIPVVVSTRHTQWMDTREDAYNSNIDRKHVDFGEFNQTI